MKDELVSMVSHELRTPLTTLLGFVDLLLTRDFPMERRKAMLGIVHQEGRRLTQLLNDFLDVQRIDAGRQEYHLEAADLGTILVEIHTLFSVGNETRSFSLDIPQELPRVLADADRLHQVLVNLLTNAVKFTAEGGHIHLVARPVDGEVEVKVQDDGAGIPTDVLPRVFEKFYRVERPGVPRRVGTGLGLALVKENIEAQGGRVWVESEVDKGSTFYFTLPIAEQDDG
jgi:signal transduction histidine kinase